MLTTGQPLAGKYMDGDKEVTDYTGITTTVDIAPHMPDWLLITITFHGGRTETYLTDTNGHSVDTGMTPVPCTNTNELTPCH